jgi:hypothetical protein
VHGLWELRGEVSKERGRRSESGPASGTYPSDRTRRVCLWESEEIDFFGTGVLLNAYKYRLTDTANGF